jgi:hypothetical protein
LHWCTTKRTRTKERKKMELLEGGLKIFETQ